MDSRFSEIQQNARLVRENTQLFHECLFSWIERLEQQVDSLTEEVVVLKQQVSSLQAQLVSSEPCAPEHPEPQPSAPEHPEPQPSAPEFPEPQPSAPEHPEMKPAVGYDVDSFDVRIVEEEMQVVAEDIVAEDIVADEAVADEAVADDSVSAVMREFPKEIQPEVEPELPFGVVELDPQAEPISEQEQQLSILEAAARNSQPEWMVDLAGPAVEDVRKALSLNDRIILIRELFGGSGDALAAALDAANQAPDLATFVAKMRVERPSWDEKSPLVYRFYMSVRRKIRK